MPGVEGQFLLAEFVFGGADGPAILEFLDLAAEGLGDDLVAKADADQGDTLGIDLADQVFERLDPVVIFINAVARAGDEPAVGGIGTLREFIIDHGIVYRLEPFRAEKARKDLGIVAVCRLKVVSDVAGLEDSDSHNSPSIGGCPGAGSLF